MSIRYELQHSLRLAITPEILLGPDFELVREIKHTAQALCLHMITRQSDFVVVTSTDQDCIVRVNNVHVFRGKGTFVLWIAAIVFDIVTIQHSGEYSLKYYLFGAPERNTFIRLDHVYFNSAYQILPGYEWVYDNNGVVPVPPDTYSKSNFRGVWDSKEQRGYNCYEI